MATRTVNGSRKARKPAQTVSEAILAADLTVWHDMSTAAREAASKDASKAGRSLALRALANVKSGESTPVDAASVILSTFGDESTVERTATFGDARRKAHAAAVRTYVSGLHKSGALVSGKGKRPTASQVSQAALATALGVTRGRISQIVMSLDSPDTHDSNGKRKDASKADSKAASKRADGMRTVGDLADAVKRVDDMLDSGVASGPDDADTLRRIAATLQVIAARVDSMTRPVVSPATVAAVKRTA